jgi:hypothetical protein
VVADNDLNGPATLVTLSAAVVASLVLFHLKAWTRCGFDIRHLDVVIVPASDLHGEWGTALVVTGDEGRARRVGAVSVTPLQ